MDTNQESNQGYITITKKRLNYLLTEKFVWGVLVGTLLVTGLLLIIGAI